MAGGPPGLATLSPVPFAAAISEHPVAARAVGEVVGSVLETMGPRPDLALLFTTPAHAGALEDMVGAVDALLHPLVLAAAVGPTVVGPHLEAGGGPAVALWAGHTGPVVGAAVGVSVDPWGAPVVSGWPSHAGFDPSAVVLLAPGGFPAEAFAQWCRARRTAPAVVGVVGAGGPWAATPLALGTRLVAERAVAVVLGPGVAVQPVLAAGSRPFGRWMTATGADGTALTSLDGRAALERLVAEVGTNLGPDEVATVDGGGLRLGVRVDPASARRPTVDIRSVLGVDRARGALVLDGAVAPGEVVRFYLHDARSAADRLRRALTGRSGDAALFFTAADRAAAGGLRHRGDAAVVADLLGAVPLAGLGARAVVAGPLRPQREAAAVAVMRARR